MTEVLIRHGEWVVICDGAKALVLENAGDTKAPNLKTREVYAQKAQPTHALGTDAPGRAMSSNGTARSAVQQTDWHEQAEREFLADLAKRLDAAVTAGEVKSIIVAAPPRALGMIRAAYTPVLRGAVRAEMDKDYVKLPVYEIEKHLAG
ncbi:MAG TPA: host attachment protein [Pseudolabrys sp.]|jgi:protein required for attachment to host cells|nr:host attachment protein [Pseudolabrys sp.]